MQPLKPSNRCQPKVTVPIYEDHANFVTRQPVVLYQRIDFIAGFSCQAGSPPLAIQS